MLTIGNHIKNKNEKQFRKKSFKKSHKPRKFKDRDKRKKKETKYASIKTNREATATIGENALRILIENKHLLKEAIAKIGYNS